MAKKIKKNSMYIIAAIICMSLSVILLFNLSNRDAMLPSLKLSGDFASYDDLVEHSPIVVTATVVSSNKEFIYEEMTFAITEVEIQECVRGTFLSRKISILQTKSKEDPFLVKGTEVLLFLSEYTGPVAENVYVINGLYNGQYRIKDNMLISVQTDKKETSILRSTKLEDVLLDVKNTEFREIVVLTATPDEIEKANQHEKDMEAQASQNQND